MPITVLEIPPALPVVDEAAAPDTGGNLILTHLVRHLDKVHEWPAITVRVAPARVLVTRNHKYLLAARLLRRSSIRAVVDAGSDRGALEALLSRSDVTPLDYETIRRDELAAQEVLAWHTVFFERPLSGPERDILAAALQPLFPQETPGEHLSLHVDHGGTQVDFFGLTRPADHTWVTALGGTLGEFGREHVRIVSYQGRRW